MPKRIIDGEALWGSSKVRKLKEEYRLHYANWIPMAEANGVFEANPEFIRSKVYGFLIPTIKTHKIQKILNAFVKAGLVKTFYCDEKTWGYFVGINKSGRLPSTTHLNRYKNLPPNPPCEFIRDNSGTSPADVGTSPADLRTTAEGFGSGSGSGSGLGIGSGMGFGLELEEQEQNMSLKKQITETSIRFFGTSIPPNDGGWTTLKPLASVYTPDAVADKFTEWAQSRIESKPRYPLTEFLREANDLLHGSLVLSSAPDGKELLQKIAFISQGTVVPDTKQSLIIVGWLQDYESIEILAAFRSFYNDLNQADDRQMKFAIRDFTQKGPLLIDVVRRNKAEDERQEKVRAQQRIELDAMAAARLANIKPDEVGVDEDELFAN